MLLVQQKLGPEAAQAIEWSNPRLLCIAGDFTKYDEHAVQQINRTIELIRYRRYGEDLLLFELVNASAPQGDVSPKAPVPGTKGKAAYKTSLEHLETAPDLLRDLFEALKAYLLALGDDVQMKPLSWYIAFKRFKNFACVEVHPNAGKLVCFVKLNPADVALQPGFTRDVRSIGHYGTGDLEITISSEFQLEQAKPLILQSYEIG